MFIIEYHYPKSDTNCHGDYWQVDVKTGDGTLLRSFGDYYHDKGGEKAVAFVDGIQFAKEVTCEVVHKAIADLEDYGDS